MLVPIQPEYKTRCSSSAMPQDAPTSRHTKRQMGALRRHRVRIVVRSSVNPGLINEKFQENSTRHPLHAAIRRSRVIPNMKRTQSYSKRLLKGACCLTKYTQRVLSRSRDMPVPTAVRDWSAIALSRSRMIDRLIAGFKKGILLRVPQIYSR